MGARDTPQPWRPTVTSILWQRNRASMSSHAMPISDACPDGHPCAADLRPSPQSWWPPSAVVSRLGKVALMMAPT